MSEATPNSSTGETTPVESGTLRRRDFVATAAGASIGAAAVAAGGRFGGWFNPGSPAEPVSFGTQRASAAGTFQPGVADPLPAFTNLLGIDLDPTLKPERIASMLRIVSDDANRLMRGTAPVGDQEPEMAELPAGLQITIGFSPELIKRLRPDAVPTGLTQIPAFSVDRLKPEWSNGELLIMVASDDPVTLAHAARIMLKDVRAFGKIRWQQPGFRHARGSLAKGTTDRNLFGQVDGTVNPVVNSDDFRNVVEVRDQTGAAAWMNGGTTLVLRRIEMNLETWDEVDRPGREASVGRRLDNGAPLTGTNEHDEPDFKARTPQGFTVINPASHMRRMRSDNPHERIYRRPYNYESPVSGGAGIGAQLSDSGQLFMSLQANVETQFVPLQRRMDEGDLLNTWITPIGSAVFAIPPTGDEFLGAALFR